MWQMTLVTSVIHASRYCFSWLTLVKFDFKWTGGKKKLYYYETTTLNYFCESPNADPTQFQHNGEWKYHPVQWNLMQLHTSSWRALLLLFCDSIKFACGTSRQRWIAEPAARTQTENMRKTWNDNAVCFSVLSGSTVPWSAGLWFAV